VPSPVLTEINTSIVYNHGTGLRAFPTGFPQQEVIRVLLVLWWGTSKILIKWRNNCRIKIWGRD